MPSASRRPVPAGLLAALLLLTVTNHGASAQDQSASSASLTRNGPTSAVHEAPTFYAEVLPILQANCQACHQEVMEGESVGGFYAAALVAPMPLETYEQARPWASAIAHVVNEGTMPPWGADVRHKGTFKGERYLEEEDKATLIAWAENGAPAGDPAQAPPPPIEETRPVGGWSIGEPDLVVRFDDPFVIDDDVIDLYVDIDVQLTEEQHSEPRWIKASELRPGTNVVHHINSDYLGTVAPGREPYQHPEGFGILLPPQASMMFDMHYHKPAGPGSGVADRSGGGMIFYEEGEIVDYVVETDVWAVTDLRVPPGDPNYSHTGSKVFDEDTYLISTAPHMHYRGKAAQLEIEYPDGEREVLLDVPRYDFEWQHKYEFNEPFLIPAGSTLHLTGWWDNSADNPHNPDPTRELTFGLPSHDEMLTGRIFYAKATPIHHVVGDPIPDELLRSPRTAEVSGEPTAVVRAGDHPATP